MLGGRIRFYFSAGKIDIPSTFPYTIYLKGESIAVEDATVSDIEPPSQKNRYKLIQASNKTNWIGIHITQDNLILSLPLCVFLLSWPMAGDRAFIDWHALKVFRRL